MKRAIDFIERKGVTLLVGIVILMTGLITMNVHLYGDDFFYARFTKVDFDYFISKHIEHYYRANGRVIVHLLATLFLGWNLWIWRVFNAIVLGGFVLFGSKIIAGSMKTEKQYGNWAAFLIAISIAFFNIAMTRQSVYWLTGSFNYVYPLLMLFIYWYLLNRFQNHRKLFWVIPIMAFLSAATVEQVSLMSVGLTILTIFEVWFIRKQKPSRIVIVSLVASILGMLTVVLAPSVFLRASIENAPVVGFIALLKYNIKIQGTTFLFSRIMLPYLLFAVVSALGIVWKYRDQKTFKGLVINRLLGLYGGSALLCWFWQMTSRLASVNYLEASYFQLLFYLFIGGGIVLVLLYASILVYLNKTITTPFLPLIAITLCFGSQFMMLISPVYGERNLFAAVMMLILYFAALLPGFNKTWLPVVLGGMICYMFNKPWLLPLVMVAAILCVPEHRAELKDSFRFKCGIAVAYICITLVATLTMTESMVGYANNAKVYEENIATAQEFISNNEEGQLTQTPLPNKWYGWVMSYENPYYTPYYNLYLEIKQDSEINWQQ
ncbi:MAG: hypothetical protein H7X94_09660 [Vallitaleaceae bacterium]|nr:hypothetical protein [Vallitaleaceae bacterium]